MPAAVEQDLRALTSKGIPYANAIRILKARGVLKQQGRHLALGPSAKKGKAK